MNLSELMNDFYYHISLYELRLMNGSDPYNSLSYNSLLYLNILWRAPGCTISQVAEQLRITKSAVTLKVNELLRRGMVEKVRSEDDKRVVHLYLSSFMRMNYEHYNRLFEKIGEHLAGQYTPSELKTFGAVLQTLCGSDWQTFQSGGVSC